MSLDAFIDEPMALLRQDPEPAGIVVRQAGFPRDAEEEGRCDAAFRQPNGARPT